MLAQIGCTSNSRTKIDWIYSHFGILKIWFSIIWFRIYKMFREIGGNRQNNIFLMRVKVFDKILKVFWVFPSYKFWWTNLTNSKQSILYHYFRVLEKIPLKSKLSMKSIIPEKSELMVGRFAFEDSLVACGYSDGFVRIFNINTDNKIS